MKASKATFLEMWKILLYSFITLLHFAISSETYMSFVSCEIYNNSACNVYNITPIIVENQVIQMFGADGNYKDPFIKSLSISAPNIAQYVPTNLFYIFPNIEEFEMSNVSMSKLTIESFANCNNLTTISIMFNNFTEIPSKIAKRCKKLNKIFFNYDEIASINENAFYGLDNLKILDLNYNKITCIPPKLFESTREIESISFKNNEIIAIDKDLFRKLRAIKIINLDGNKISFIPMMNFYNTAINLIMNNNPVSAIEPKFIEKFLAIENSFSSINLTMSSTESSCIPNGFKYSIIQSINYKFANDALADCYAEWSDELILKAQTVCSSESSLLTEIFHPLGNICQKSVSCRYYFDHLKQYTCVIDEIDSEFTSISGNHISEMLTDASVVNVFITNSKLSTIPSVVFEKFSNLAFLTITNSTMTFIHERTMTMCENLKYLDVSHNDIMHISKYAFKMCSNLQIIDLSENPIEYLDIQYARRLKRIYLNKRALFE